MLDGYWRVYLENGSYLGRFCTNAENTVLWVNQETADRIFTNEVLHMDEVEGTKAWKVKVTGNCKGRPNELLIKKIGDRQERYPVENKRTKKSLIERLFGKRNEVTERR